MVRSVRGLNLGMASWVFLIVVFLATIPATLCMPAGGGADGATQIARVDQLSRGDIIAQRVGHRRGGNRAQDQIYGGAVDSALWKQAYSAIIISQLEHSPLRFPTFSDPRANGHGVYGDRTEIHAFTNTAVYSPIVYAPQILGLKIARHFTRSPYKLILVMCFCGILAYALIGWLAIALLPWGKWILTVSLLVPAGLLTISNVSADTMTTASVALLFAITFRATCRGRLSKAGWMLFGLSGMMVAGVKTTYAPALVLLVLPLLSRSMRTRKNVVKMFVSVLMSATVLFLWYLQVLSLNTGVTDGPNTQPELQKAFILAQPLQSLGNLFKQGFSSFDLFVTGLPNWGSRTVFRPQTLVIAAFIAAVSYEIQTSWHKFREVNFTAVGIVLVVVGVMSILLMELAEWLHFTHFGDMIINGVQERYFIPDQPFFIFPLAFLLSNNATTESALYASRIGVREKAVAIFVGLPAVITSWIVCVSFYFPQTV